MVGSEGFDEVERKFEEATNLIDQLASNISRLTETEENRKRVASSVKESNNQLQQLVSNLEELISEWKNANENILEAFETAQKFLAGTDLTQVQDQISEMNDKNDKIIGMLNSTQVQDQISEVNDKNDKIIGMFKSLVEDSLAELSEMKEEKEILGRELESLKAKIGTLPDRLKRKLGLT